MSLNLLSSITRGRDIFKIVYPFLRLFSFVLYLLPGFIINSLWILADLLPGLLGVGFRYILAFRLAKSIGKNVFFGRGVEIKSWKNLEIGSNVSIHKDCYIDAAGGLIIKNDVSIAHNSSILTFEHTWENKDEPIRSNPVKLNSVKIENDVWIGCGCRVLSGVTIGNRAIVAAGAVVSKDIEQGTLAGGVPAKFIKKVG
jgi:acetyltransferase-like isoleucine patch superfamily enzyme